MTRSLHLLTLLAVVAVPVIGWFVDGWSGATTLLVYWFENVAACLLIAARVFIHQRLSPRRGHFRYEAPSGDRRTPGSFLSGFVVTSLAFCAAHGVVLGAIVILVNRNSGGMLAEVDWRSVELGCTVVFAVLVIDFAVDLMRLRHWSFRQIEQTASIGLGRVVVVHLALLIGFAGIALTDAPTALFGSFVVLKTFFALSTALPQWEPTAPPPWLSRMMNRVPRTDPDETFEDRWAEDRADETARVDRNEQPWIRERR